MSNPKWHILGFGVIGQLLHAALSRSGQTCVIIPKGDERLPANHRVQYQGRPETFTIQAPYAGKTNIERLVVCTKSYAVIEAVESIQSALTEQTQLIVMVNGLIDAAELSKRTPASVYWALTTEGGYRTAPYTTVHGGSGLTRLGSGPEPEWFADWQKALPNSYWHHDIRAFQWEKLCVNAVINPLTALHQCCNGELANGAQAKATQSAIEEATSILEALGFHTQAKGFNDTCWEVIRKTAANRSSMLQDVNQHRRTEIDSIVPPLLDAAAKHGLATPQLESTYRAFCGRFPGLN